MDTSGVIQLISIIVLIFLSGFFSSAETALSTVNRVRMRSLEEEGNKRAARVNKILDNYSKMISTILIGNNIVNLTASSLATTLAMRINLAVGIATGILTIVVLLCGEIVPKTWAVLCSEKLALTYCNIIYLLMQVLTPVIIVVDLLSHGIMKLLHIDPNKKASAMTESELKTYVDVSHEDGVIESEERKLIYNVFDFSDAHAKDIMIPRINMVTVSLDATYDDVLAVFRDSMYTRLPVYEDDKDNIIGLINIKDFILTEDQSAFHVGNILRDAYYTYEAPGHKECKLCRLHDPQDIDGGRLINGLSHFLPSGGGTEFADNAMESIYYIVEGTMLFKGDDGVETVLEAGDSVHIAPHSKKSVTNIGTTTAQMLVILLPEAAK